MPSWGAPELSPLFFMNQRPVPEKVQPEAVPAVVSHRSVILANPGLVKVLVSKPPLPPAISAAEADGRNNNESAAATKDLSDFMRLGLGLRGKI